MTVEPSIVLILGLSLVAFIGKAVVLAAIGLLWIRSLKRP
jgi:hypothetical protein